MNSKVLIPTLLIGLVSAGVLIKTSYQETPAAKHVAFGEIQNSASSTNKKQVQNAAVQLINTNKKVKLTQKERECLARNVFFEAGIESHEGKIAVAQATLNRVQHPTRWKSDVCAVVYQKAQFSWTLQKKKRQEKPTGELWVKTLKAVAAIENGVRIKGLETATFYHTDWIRQPKWACDSKKIMQVGQHIFYRDDIKV